MVAEAAKGRSKVSDRCALLKKALAGETAAAHHKLLQGGGGACIGQPPLPFALAAAAQADCGAPTAEDEDAVSALFELSSSVW